MKKNYLKTNVTSFILSIIIFSCIGIYAVVNFPSNEVTYNNKESGLKSTNVKDAIDELYTECTSKPAGEQIVEKEEIVTSGDGLYEDEYEDGRYIYRGISPKNFIQFNNELWRIISVENDETIKIMRNNYSEEHFTWDVNLASGGNNNWDRPASLNTYLNNTYYNSLTSKAQNQIVQHDWSIGKITEGNNNLISQIDEENSTKWSGEIGLITASEYIRANSNIKKCGNFNLEANNKKECSNTNWMLNIIDIPKTNYFWTITAYNNSIYSIALISGDDYDYGLVYTDFDIHNPFLPVLYLSPNIKITGGTGTQNDPYTIE